MRLEELARTAPFARPLTVPACTLGCFHRRSITYANGAEDAATRVIWIQSHGLTGDLRIPARRPEVGGRASIADCTPEQQVELAKGEGGVADTAFADGRWRIALAVDPFMEGRELDLDGFASGEPGYLSQTLTCGTQRLWRIDTLLADQPIDLATPALAEGEAWLAREAGVLLG
jgi:hypothetical protein